MEFSTPKPLSLNVFYGIFLSALILNPGHAVAIGEVAQTFTLDGQLFSDPVSTTPLIDANAKINLQILDASQACILYEESQMVSTTTTNGAFNIQVGSAMSATKRGANDSNNAMATVYANFAATSVSGKLVSSGAPCSYYPALGDQRYLRMTVTPSGGSAITLSPNMAMDSVPSAIVAENAVSLQGLQPNQLLQIGTGDLTQNNLQSVLATGNAAKLLSLLSVPPANYVTVSSTSGAVQLPSVSSTPTAPAAGEIWYQGGNLEYYDGTSVQTVNVAGSGITSLNVGSGLTPQGTITAGGSTIAVDSGTGANQIVMLNSLAQLPAVDGYLLSNINAAKIATRAVSSSSPTAGQVLAFNGTTLQWEPKSGSGIIALNGDVVATGPGAATATIQANAVTSAKINSSGIAINRLLITDAAAGATVTFGSCSINQVYQWTATGWACADVSTMLGTTGVTAGTYGNSVQVPQVAVDSSGRVVSLSNVNIAFPVLSVAGRTGAVTLNTSDISGLGSAALQNYGSAAGNVVQLDGSAHIPASLLPASTGTITQVVAGLAMIGGGTSGAVTLGADVGTIANKIVQFDSTAKYPGNDGSQITNVNASRIGTRSVASILPTAGQSLIWNSINSDWEPSSPVLGSVTNVSAGNGLIGGSITTVGTLAVDAGSTANKIVQLNPSAQIPSVDGSLVTNISAVKLQSRTVSAAVPTAGQVLAWNSAHLDWEPTLAATGSVTAVVAGNGLIAGTIATVGTLNVDVGTSANKIVQFTPTGQYPAVSGNLITNVNAANLQGMPIATTPPTASQILTFNASTSKWDAENAMPSASSFVNGGNTFGGPATLGTNDANSLTIKTNGTPAVTILTNGNVGINTSNPLSALDINGGVALGSYAGSSAAPFGSLILTGGVGIGTTSSGASSLSIVGNSNGNTQGSISVINNGGFSGSRSTISFGGGGQQTEIGMSSPAFSVFGAIGPKTGYIYNLYGDVALDAGGTIRLSTGGNSAANERLRIDSAGNVGVGTTNPGYNFDLVGAFHTSGNNLVGGKVGIGTVTPSLSLDVYGSTVFRGPSIGGIDGELYYNTSTHSYQFYNASSSSWESLASGSVTYTGSTWAINGSNTYYNAGLVSIGTSASLNSLDVAGATAIGTFAGVKAAPSNGLAVSGNVGIGTSSPSVTLEVAGQNVAVDGSGTTPGELRLGPGPTTGVKYVGFKGPSSNPAANILWQLPAADGTSGQALTTNASGGLYWSSYLTSASTIVATKVTSGQIAVANGGTGTATGSITGTGALAFTAGGSNQNLTLAPSGTGSVIVGGHLAVGGATPSIASCGTGASIVGNDSRGNIAVGTGSVSSCSITFASPFASAPFCVATWSGSANATGIAISSASTTAMTIVFSASAPSTNINYICLQ